MVGSSVSARSSGYPVVLADWPHNGWPPIHHAYPCMVLERLQTMGKYLGYIFQGKSHLDDYCKIFIFF